MGRIGREAGYAHKTWWHSPKLQARSKDESIIGFDAEFAMDLGSVLCVKADLVDGRTNDAKIRGSAGFDKFRMKIMTDRVETKREKSARLQRQWFRV
jgi:hypothetical protein